jgi:ArsR family transcriptional regulator, arsenate/arsenite/antimonite-responsive transcriptional repressor
MSTESNRCCPPSEEQREPIDAFDVQEFADFARALGHPARVAIVRILIERDTCICGELVEELPLAQSTVSQHLKQLKSAGIIRGEVDGPRVCYCIEPRALSRFKALVGLLDAGFPNPRRTHGSSPCC